jgi:hypothetical protein
MESLLCCSWIFSFQHTFSSLLKQKSVKTSPPPKSRGTMAISMREVDPAFQGAGQKEYPSVAYFVTGLHNHFTYVSYVVLSYCPMNIIYLHLSLLSCAIVLIIKDAYSIGIFLYT